MTIRVLGKERIQGYAGPLWVDLYQLTCDRCGDELAGPDALADAQQEGWYALKTLPPLHECPSCIARVGGACE